MYKMPKIRIGLIPTKRHPFRLEAALPQKQRYYDIFSQIDADVVEYVDIDDICENGIIADPRYCQAVIDKFIKARVDAIFLEFLDFGNEESVSTIASALKVPTLVWGARDPAPEDDRTVLVCTITKKGVKTIKTGYYTPETGWVVGMNNRVIAWSCRIHRKEEQMEYNAVACFGFFGVALVIFLVLAVLVERDVL